MLPTDTGIHNLDAACKSLAGDNVDPVLSTHVVKKEKAFESERHSCNGVQVRVPVVPASNTENSPRKKGQKAPPRPDVSEKAPPRNPYSRR